VNAVCSSSAVCDMCCDDIQIIANISVPAVLVEIQAGEERTQISVCNNLQTVSLWCQEMQHAHDALVHVTSNMEHLRDFIHSAEDKHRDMALSELVLTTQLGRNCDWYKHIHGSQRIHTNAASSGMSFPALYSLA
jgi:hypothetical protein